jgi:NAD(P)-dependent dehydrogenase (short-subunit alcohol dehydrogenase family)
MFRGKIVVVTGAAGGIGRCLCERLLAEGATVCAWDIRGLEPLLEKARQQAWDLYSQRIDVTQSTDVENAAREAVQRHRRIDYWFNNAGVAGLGGFLDTSADAFDKVVAINFRAVVLGTRVALKEFETLGAGTIINMASVAGHVAAPYMTAYSATKHAVVGFTRALQQELRLRDSPVKLFLVSPGFVDTDLIARGQRLGFPEWLSWALATPEKVVSEMLRAMARGKTEIFPTWNGRLMLHAHRLFPEATRRSSRLLLVRQLKDLVLNRYTVDE